MACTFGLESCVSESLHPSAPHDLPGFITAPGDTDILMVVVGLVLIGSVLMVGNLYLHLHSLPERMAHKSQKLQFEIVAVLGLLALFTHIHLFWVVGLLLAMVDLPDFGTPLRRIAGSVEKIAGVPPGGEAAETASAGMTSESTAHAVAAEASATANAGAAKSVLKAEGQIQQAKGDYQQAFDELDTKRELQKRNPGIVPRRDIEKLEVLQAGRQGALDPQRLRNNPRRSASRLFSPRRRQAPRRRWPRRRWIWTRPSFVRESRGGWSSSRCAWETLLVRSCAPPAFSFLTVLDDRPFQRGLDKSKRRS
jgi:hypothetical protein